MQSPIGFDISQVQHDPAYQLTSLYTDFDQAEYEEAKYQIRISGGNETGDLGGIKITDLNGQGPFTYKVDHLHFHRTSEHIVNGKKYDSEMHIVHKLHDGPVDLLHHY